MKKIFLSLLLCIVISIFVIIYIKLSALNHKKQLITLFNWGEFIDNEIIENFNKANDKFEIKQNLFSSNETAINKIKSGNHYDIVILSEYAIEQLKSENLLQSIDFNKIKIMPEIKDNVSNILKQSHSEIFVDNDNKNDRYSIPYVWGTVGLLYNKNKIIKSNIEKEWQSEFKNGNNKIALYNNPKESLFIGLKAINANSIDKPSDEEIERATQWLIDIKDKNSSHISFVTDQILYHMQESGKERYDIAVVYSGDAEYLMKKNNNLQYYTFGNQGTNVWFDGMVIPKNANIEGSYDFINYLLKDDNLKKNYEYIGYYSPYKVVNDLQTEKEFQQYPDHHIIYRYEKSLNEKIFKAWDKIYSQPIDGDRWIFFFSIFIIILMLFLNLLFKGINQTNKIPFF